jgi:stage V sporulation protein AE
MIFLAAFLFCGLISLIGQLILENTKLTPGHVNTILAVIGSILTGFGLYQEFLNWAGAGAVVPITNFGYLLVDAAYEGYLNGGFTELIKSLLGGVSGGLTITILIAFLVSITYKPKN